MANGWRDGGGRREDEGFSSEAEGQRCGKEGDGRGGVSGCDGGDVVEVGYEGCGEESEVRGVQSHRVDCR